MNRLESFGFKRAAEVGITALALLGAGYLAARWNGSETVYASANNGVQEIVRDGYTIRKRGINLIELDVAGGGLSPDKSAIQAGITEIAQVCRLFSSPTNVVGYSRLSEFAVDDGACFNKIQP